MTVSLALIDFHLLTLSSIPESRILVVFFGSNGVHSRHLGIRETVRISQPKVVKVPMLYLLNIKAP